MGCLFTFENYGNCLYYYHETTPLSYLFKNKIRRVRQINE